MTSQIVVRMLVFCLSHRLVGKTAEIPIWCARIMFFSRHGFLIHVALLLDCWRGAGGFEKLSQFESFPVT